MLLSIIIVFLYIPNFIIIWSLNIKNYVIYNDHKYILLIPSSVAVAVLYMSPSELYEELSSSSDSLSEESNSESL
jgi:glucose-6-phosphate-specific signal transduction histidine kinase